MSPESPSLPPRSTPPPLVVLPPPFVRPATGVAIELDANGTSATPVLIVPGANVVSRVDVHAEPEVQKISGTPTPPPRIGVFSAREATVGVGVGADVGGSRHAATPTPPVLPPPPAVAVDKVDVSAENDPKETSRTPTLSAIGHLHLAVGVAAKTGRRGGSATSTPMRLLLSIAPSTMGAVLDDEVMQ